MQASMRRKLYILIIIYILKDTRKNFKECYFKKREVRIKTSKEHSKS